MNTIKKTTLIAVITTMAAIAVPSMASAAVWTPPNTNKTLTATAPVVYTSNYFIATCTNSTLGVHTGPTGTLTVTSASFTSCTSTQYGGNSCGPATITATGLPWAVTSSGAPNVTFTEHLTVTVHCLSETFTIDGPVTGTYTNATHTLNVLPTSTMGLFYMGHQVDSIYALNSFTYHETTNTLTLI